MFRLYFYCFIVVCLIFSLPHHLFAAVVEKDVNLEATLQNLYENSLIIKSIEADFAQEKHVSFINETVRSAGHFSFKAPQNIVWEYTSPIASTMRYEDGIASIWQGQNKIDQSANGRGPSIAAKILAENVLLWTKPEPKLLLKQFNITVLEKAPITLRLTPKNLKPNSPISALQMTFSNDAKSMQQIILYEQGDDFTKINFSNVLLTN